MTMMMIVDIERNKKRKKVVIRNYASLQKNTEKGGTERRKQMENGNNGTIKKRESGNIINGDLLKVHFRGLFPNADL